MSKRRILSFVLALVMVLGTFSTVFAAESTGNVKVDWLRDEGLVLGDEGGLRLKDQITRAEVATMLVRALDLEEVAKASMGFPSAFADMNSPDVLWARGYVTVAAAEGLIKGYEDGTFGPRRDITYAEVATMLVRVLGGLTEAEEKLATGMNWATVYLTKAAQLGIFEGVSVLDYSAKAERETMFEMVYNAIVNKQIGNYTIVKGIVLENSRVESIGKDEIVVEVLRELQRANYADASRYDKGDQERFTLELKVGDVENLLGKVADFTLDKDGKIISVKVDNSFSYVSGNAKATKNKLTIGSKTYTVELDERYKSQDERIFRTYLNDDAFAYEDFYQDPSTMRERSRKAEFSVDYAKATIKNGKVLFVDSFVFDDIAPVESVKKDGAEVYVYNDQRDARIEKYTPGTTVVGVVERDSEMAFSRIDRADIKANDVVHVYKTNRLVVRQDALVDGKFERVTEATRGNFSVQVDGERYYMNDVNYRRPVYSYDSKEFMTLYANRATTELNGFKDEEVSVLLDINSDLQYIGAKIDFHEGVAIIDQILSRGLVRYVDPRNEKFELAETFNTDLRIPLSTINQRMSEFNRGDLTFVVNEDDNIDTMIRLATATEINTDAKLVKKNTNTKFEMNSDYIRLDNGTRYNLLNRTNVFRVEFNTRGEVARITGTTVADVRSGVKAAANLRAFVLTDDDIDEMRLGNRIRTSGRADVAHTIVFVDYEGVAPSLNYEMIRVTRLSSANVTNRWIEGVTADGTKVDYVISRGTDMDNIMVDDIVELGLSKDDAKTVESIERKIAWNAPTFKIVDMDSRTEYRWVKLADKNGYTRTPDFWVSISVEEFGTIAIEDVVTFSTNNAGDIDVIRSYGRTKAVTGEFPGSVIPPTKYAKLDSVYKIAGQVWVRIDDVDYRYVGLQSEADLLVLVGQRVLVEELKLGTETTVVKVTAAPIAPIVDKAALITAINNGAALVPNAADYTEASWDAMIAKWNAAVAVRDNVDATQAQVNTAASELTTAITALEFKPGTISATGVKTTLVGVTKVDITVTGATAADVEKVLVNGSEVVIREATGNVVKILSGDVVTSVKIVIAGLEYTVTL